MSGQILSFNAAAFLPVVYLGRFLRSDSPCSFCRLFVAALVRFLLTAILSAVCCFPCTIASQTGRCAASPVRSGRLLHR